MTRKELSAVVAECAARTERAEASIRESVARGEASRVFHEKALDAVRLKQEEALARQEAATAKLEEQRVEANARWKEERVAMRKAGERQDKALEESARKTDAIIAELRDARDERRAMLEALFKVIDRLPPPPPNLRSA